MDRKKTGDNGVRHEHRDIKVGTVAIVGVVLLGLLAIIGHVVPWIAFRLMEKEAPPEAAAAPPLEESPPPPLPRLQANPQADLARMRFDAEEQLRSFGWADRPNGIVRIPIERAMDLIVERGLPVAASAGREQRDSPESPGAKEN